MSFKFEFDQEAFERAVKDQVNDVLDERAATLARVLKEASEAGHGNVDRVEEALSRSFAAQGWTADRSTLRQYAEELAAGRSIKVKPEHMR